VIPEAAGVPQATPPVQQTKDVENSRSSVDLPQTSNPTLTLPHSDDPALREPLASKKRPCDELESTTNGHVTTKTGEAANTEGESSRKKKKKRGHREKTGAV
jgi:ribonuclease P/MRP protein subunit RPP1